MEEKTVGIDWVDEIIAKLEGATGGVLEVKIGNETISTIVGDEFIKFFKDNKVLLIRLGKDMFRSFLLLIHEKRDEEAFQLLLSRMEADEIIARMRINASQLAQLNQDHDNFIAALKKWAIMFLTGVTTKLLIGLLV